MAKLESKIAIDMSVNGLNFDDLLDGKDATFNSKLIRLEYKKTNERDTFYGSFTANAASRTISGTAKKWVHSKGGDLQWQITSASISAAAVLKAAKSKTLTDDRAIIQKTFSGDDTVQGSKFDDKLFGYGGDDKMIGGAGIDRIDGGDGNDRVVYDSSVQAITLALNGSTPSYAFINGVQSDRVVNVEGIVGGTRNDTLSGDKKNNLLVGNGGDDTLTGNGGKDTLNGGNGNDSMSGGSGNDSIIAGSGNDYASGGSGNDTIDGGAGMDTIYGGKGKDVLTGGADADTFVYAAVSDSSGKNVDFITDFKRNVDRIDLSLIDAMASLGGNDAFILDGKGNANTAVAEGHIGWYQVNKPGTANDRTFIRVNVDGDADIEMTIEFKGKFGLSTTDFIL